MKGSTTHIPGLTLTDHTFTVPLDYLRPEGGRIEVYAREVTAAGKDTRALPWLVFLQGGPGGTTTRPKHRQGWIKRATQDYRVLLLDQRGTGRSTPVTTQTLARFESPHAVADYLKHFRADNIVRDAEAIRPQLIGSETWSILGQSFGGFCAATYLSFAPHGLREAIITGGLPPFVNNPDAVYRATYPRVLEKNKRYFARYPDDAQLAIDIMKVLHQHEARLPNGDVLTPRRFQILGMGFGAHDGFEETHYVLERAFVRGPHGRELSHQFRLDVMNAHNFDTNPVYAILHEACYCQGAASRWSAERIRGEFTEFDSAPGSPVLFTGEMIYPWMFDDFAQLKPLREAAHILADYDGWPMLYDVAALARNSTPCVAAMYYNDMYVDRVLSQHGADTINGIKIWVTSEHEHNGLRADGEHVLDHLLALLRGQA